MILKQSSSFDLMESAVRFTRLALLTVVHWTLFGRVKTGKSAQKSPKRILIMRFSAVGDFILAVPSINALRKAFPESEILLLTAASSNRAIRDSTVMYNLSSHPAPWVQFVHPSRVNEVVWIDSFELSSLRVNVRPKIEAFKPELAFILPQQEGGTVRSLITKMVFLRSLGVRCAVLGWRSGTGPLFRKRRYEAGRIEHAVSAPLKAVHEHRKLGKLDLNTVSFNLDIPEEDLKWADQLLRQQGCLEFKMVAVSLSSVQPHKQWGIEHFIALCQKLRQEEGVYVLLVGTKETREPGDEIVRLLGTRGLNLCGQTTITKLAAILRHCSLVVGNDGGTMHVAAAVGRKSVSIMPGIEYPGSIEPWGNAENAIREKVDCSPCYSFMRCPLGHMKCMTSIKVDSVLTRCRLLLRSISTPPDQACLKTK